MVLTTEQTNITSGVTKNFSRNDIPDIVKKLVAEKIIPPANGCNRIFRVSNKSYRVNVYQFTNKEGCMVIGETIIDSYFVDHIKNMDDGDTLFVHENKARNNSLRNLFA